MKIFFDTEFTGLHRNTTLISIGLISENNKKFYAEFTDYDKEQIDEWIQNNVINKLNLNYLSSNIEHSGVSDTTDSNFIKIRGTKSHIRKTLKEWLEQFYTVEWVSDVCHYDFVLLIDLIYGHALKMPYGKHCSACHDINQDIAKYYDISEIDAFDLSREEILETNDISISEDKHNALYDAEVIKACYEVINRFL